jgi:hypothetical protein
VKQEIYVYLLWFDLEDVQTVDLLCAIDETSSQGQYRKSKYKIQPMFSEKKSIEVPEMYLYVFRMF